MRKDFTVHVLCFTFLVSSANVGFESVSASDANVYFRNRRHERLHANKNENLERRYR